MEKSMVNELRSLAHSSVWTQSQITTSNTDNVYDLRKSRINNLPNYKKTDLSGKLNFIVAFQAIEIQRLSVEVEALRVKLLEAERIVFTNGNYQVQIKQLTEKCIAMELERQEYKAELQKMNTICQNLYHELEGVKNAYAEMEQALNAKQRQNDQLKRMIENYKAKLGEMDQKLKNSEQITFQHNQLVIKCQNLQNQLAASRQKNQQAQEQFKRKKRELKDDFEKQIVNFTNENNSIKSNLDRALRQIADWKQKSNEMAERIDKYIDIEKNKLKLQKELKAQKQINSDQICELRKRNNALQEDLANLVHIVDDRSRKIKQLKQFLKEIENKNDKKVQDCLKQIQQLIRSVDESKKQAEYFEDKLVLAENQIMRLQNENDDIKLQANEVCQELQKKHSDLKRVQTEIRNLEPIQRKYVDSENKVRQIERQLQNESSKARDAIKKMEVMNITLEKMKNEGVLSQDFVNQFMKLKQLSAQKEKQIENMMMRLVNIEHVILFMRQQLQKQYVFSEQNTKKWAMCQKSIGDLNSFMNKAIQMHNELAKIAQQNVRLQSNNRILNFQIEATPSEQSQILKSESSFTENISKLSTSKSNYQLHFPRSALTPKNQY